MTAQPAEAHAPVVEVLVEDELDISTLPRLRAQLQEATQLRPQRLVVDLSRCAFLDAQAITVLVEAHRRTWLSGGRLVLRGCDERMLRLFALAGVHDVFAFEPAAAQPVWHRADLRLVAG